jgi:serine/threonine protein phosphatase PrpC
MSKSNVRVTVQSDKGKWKRRNDEYFAYLTPEDPILESTNGTILVIADGQGGNINSNLCAKISVESAIEFYGEEDAQIPIENRLNHVFQKVHLLIKEKAESFHTPGMVCALTILVILENDLWVGQVGNNAVFLINPKSEVINIKVETSELVGQDDEITPLIQKKSLEAVTRVLLVTDGVTDQISHDAIVKATTYASPSVIVNHLIQLSNDKGGEDNATACLIEIGKFSKKTIQVQTKDTEPIKRKEKKVNEKRKETSFWIWILLIVLLASGIFLTKKYYPKLMVYLLPGTDKPIKEEVVKPSEMPPIVKVIPEASLLVSVTPRIVTVFFYEGEISLNEKQKNPIFSSESTPVIIKGLKIGTYTLIVGKEGYEPQRVVIQIKDTDLSKQHQYPLVLKPLESDVGSTIPEPPTNPIETKPTNPPVQEPTGVSSELTIQSDPTGAKIFINGEPTGLITPNVIKKKPGVYLVQVMKDGYESASRSVDLSGESSKQSIFFPLKALPVSLSVTSQPGGAKIYLDNIFTSLYTPSTLSLSLGSHTIMVGKAGFEEQSITITIKPGVIPQPISFILKRKLGTNNIINIWTLPYED